LRPYTSFEGRNVAQNHAAQIALHVLPDGGDGLGARDELGLRIGASAGCGLSSTLKCQQRPISHNLSVRAKLDGGGLGTHKIQTTAGLQIRK
jgi:hypothetical protein